MKDLITISHIPYDRKLAIFDVFDTLIIEPNERSDIWEVRIGFKELVDYMLFIQSKAAICSDDQIDRVKEKLGWGLPYIQEKMKGSFIGVYGNGNKLEINGVEYKNLGRICKIAEVKPSQAFMGGDDYLGKDSRSSRLYKVPFLLVPNGRIDPDFSLENLIQK